MVTGAWNGVLGNGEGSPAEIVCTRALDSQTWTVRSGLGKRYAFTRNLLCRCEICVLFGSKTESGLDHGISQRDRRREGRSALTQHKYAPSFWKASRFGWTMEGHRGFIFATLFLIVASFLFGNDGLMHHAGTG